MVAGESGDEETSPPEKKRRRPAPPPADERDAELAALRSQVEELRTDAERWRSLKREVPYFIAVYDADGRVIDYGDGAAEFFGLSPEELEAVRNGYNVLADPWLDASGTTERFRTVYAGTASELPLTTYQVPGRTPGVAERKWFEGFACPVKNAEGQVVEVISVLLDVTARHQAQQSLRRTEERLHSVIENAPVVLWTLDRDGVFTLSEGKGLEALGLKPGQVVGQSVFEVYREVPPILEAARRALAGESMSIVIELGDLRFEAWHASLFDESGHVVGAYGFAIDVTERRRAEEERSRTEAQIQETQRLEGLGVLAGGIAHDFNNLLVGVLGNADLALLDLPPRSPVEESLEEIRSAALHAAELTQQLLAYAGKGRFVLEPLHLSHLVAQMRPLLDTVISRKASVRFQLAEDLPVIEADSSQIRQVVLNFVTNASEALKEAEGVIWLRTDLVEVDRAFLASCRLGMELPEGPYVSLEVSDTGTGMSVETERKMFEPFFSTRFMGRGLGLAAVLGIVRGHRGALYVQTEPGRGTTVQALFPCGDGRAQVAGASLASAASRPRTILVVDDDRRVLNVARRMLERSGFGVLTATDGREGVEIFGRHQLEIALVLLDVKMSGLSGEETFARMREIQPQVRVLLSSGYDEREATRRFDNRGIAGFIQKPYRAVTLVEKIREALGE